jgi:uncharacterized protein YgiM (DUF1202 family)
MQAHTKSLIFVILAGLMSAAMAEEAATAPQKSATASEANKPAAIVFPYIANVTDDNVNIRSGPGTNYYSCGKLSKTDKVKIVGSQFGWSRIVPPADSFSWISKQHISIEAGSADTGVVAGEAVRIYAGSEDLNPIHSTAVQCKLNKNDRVKLMGKQEESEYYKIVPPDGAYLWVNTRYTEPAASGEEISAAEEAAAEPNAVEPGIAGSTPSTSSGQAGSPQAGAKSEIRNPVEAVRLKEYYELKRQFGAEQTKPIDERNYARMKKALTEIAGDKDAGKAGRYAEFMVRQIECCELGLTVAKELPAQDSQFKQVADQIEKAKAAKLAEIPDMGKYAVIGLFQTSSIYGPEAGIKRYRITDETGKTLCYVMPNEAVKGMNLDGFVGHRVGLVGTIEAEPQSSGAIIRFTEVVKMK